MAEQTWNETEMPILEAVRSLEMEANHFTDVNSYGVIERSGLDAVLVNRTLLHLCNASYIDMKDASTLSGTEYYGIMLAERGRRVVGQWPSSDPFESLHALLAVMIANETDDERKSRLKSFLDGLTGMGRDVGTAVLAAYTKQVLGI